MEGGGWRRSSGIRRSAIYGKLRLFGEVHGNWPWNPLQSRLGKPSCISMAAGNSTWSRNSWMEPLSSLTVMQLIF